MTFSAEVYYRHGHGSQPLIVRSEAQVDELVDALLAAPFDTSLATLYIVERPLNAAGFPDHEFAVGVDSEGGVGGLRYSGNSGTWYSLGTHSSDRSDRSEVFYCHMGEERLFPPDSEIPISLIRQAVKEFLAAGGHRPACVSWRPYRADTANTGSPSP